jgi:D-alanyl-D-alanine carboxypeptidase
VIHPRALAVTLTAAMVLAAASPGPAPSATAGRVAACRYADVLTRYRSTSDWNHSLLDTELRLPAGYAPDDLVPLARAGVPSAGRVRRLVIADLAAMYWAARRAGAPFAVQSAYRSYRTQVATFGYWVSVAGRPNALLSSARPGHSEHQLGTALDFKTPGGAAPWYHPDWGRTRAGAWLAGNAWKYGFVMSHPKGQSPSFTCYRYEPWHYRYVGRPIARAIHDSGRSPREWLYGMGASGTWRWGIPTPGASPTPTPGTSPTPGASPTPTPGSSPTPGASPTPGTSPTPTPGTSPTPTPAPMPEPTPAPGPVVAPSPAL